MNITLIESDKYLDSGIQQMRTSKLYSVLLFISWISIISVFSFCSENGDLLTTPEDTNLELKVTYQPQEVKSTNGKVNLLYSVEISNFKKDGYDLKDFQVFDAANKSMLCSIKDTNKYLIIHKPTQESIPDDFYYYPGESQHVTYRFSVGLAMDPTAVPKKIINRLVLVKGNIEKIIEGKETEVLKKSIPIISPPLRGERYVSGRTTILFDNHHPKSQITYKGRTTAPTRFSVDWNKIDAAGNAYIGDSKICSSWYVYGQNVYAVADGQVVSVKDGMPDQSPVGTVSSDLNLFNGEGNSVVMFIAGGYAVYAHLIPNSITVKAGQIIDRGTLIGKVGNSGASYAPHLHFGLHSDYPYYISEGLPYYIDSLEKTGSVGKAGGTYTILPLPTEHKNEIVENWGVYNLK